MIYSARDFQDVSRMLFSSQQRLGIGYFYIENIILCIKALRESKAVLHQGI